MDKKLKETVKRAQKEVEKLLAEVQAGNLDKNKLEGELKEVQKDMKIIDIHTGGPDHI
jgi:hypothetical protein